MDANSILNGLMNATAWIEDVIINGLLGQGFGLLRGNSGIIWAIISMFAAMFGMG